MLNRMHGEGESNPGPLGRLGESNPGPLGRLGESNPGPLGRLAVKPACVCVYSKLIGSQVSLSHETRI